MSAAYTVRMQCGGITRAQDVIADSRMDAVILGLDILIQLHIEDAMTDGPIVVTAVPKHMRTRLGCDSAGVCTVNAACPRHHTCLEEAVFSRTTRAREGVLQ
ncbi:hypothetical protein AZ34_12005 [Hylemonella gracilis str. Niagara R]|uniref:Uncharacterized protein n=1 Tax=Hylemonella gracilis str. Niagara R TaxID=1458275 RepID=A0A016XNV1_9BURK|nr:hypothetical protein [Hylemonella gracilis]EYC52898.1 hypothetical protein AZ34_12005 [Hylemonella gracilis str. Niagara R]